MKLGLLAFLAIGVSLGLVACSEDAATNPNVDSGALNPVEISSSSDFLGAGFPGVELSSSSFFMPGIELSSSSIAGPGFGISSSSFVWPGPVVSSSSVVIPGGNNPGNESGDDENDNDQYILVTSENEEEVGTDLGLKFDFDQVEVSKCE